MKKTSGPKWPFIVGPLISVPAIVMGSILSVGPYCGAAFALSHGTNLASSEAACNAMAQAPRLTYFALIGFGIALVIFGIAVRVFRPEPVSRVFVSAETANRRRMREQDVVLDRGLRWPFILGPLISVAGIVMGYKVPVGPNCSGAFDGDHMEATAYDIAHATVLGIPSYAAEACRAAAPGQTGIYWGIIGFGIAIVILGAVLRSLANRQPATAAAPPAVSVADELTRLDGLRQRGILTDAEFEAEKGHLLRR